MKKFIQDIGWSFASLAISSAVHFILRIFLARYIGEDSLGIYTLSFTVYSFGLILAGFGLESALLKHVAQYKENSSILSAPLRR